MSNRRNITELLREQKHFKIRLPRYDGGANIFWPEYRLCKVRVMKGDVVATWFGEDIEMGTVTNVIGDLVSLTIIRPNEQASNVKIDVKLHRNRVHALMHPE